ncbi:MAG: phage holin family protein [bacterium]|nr:phage holin family protein [bacterium]
MKDTLQIFIVRWFLNSFALWILVSIFGDIKIGADTGTFFLAGFIFSLFNSMLKPVLKILALPAIILTLGIFTIFVNGFILWLSIKVSPNLSMSFWNSVVAGAVMSFVNYLLTESVKEKEIL